MLRPFVRAGALRRGAKGKDLAFARGQCRCHERVGAEREVGAARVQDDGPSRRACASVSRDPDPAKSRSAAGPVGSRPRVRRPSPVAMKLAESDPCVPRGLPVSSPNARSKPPARERLVLVGGQWPCWLTHHAWQPPRGARARLPRCLCSRWPRTTSRPDQVMRARVVRLSHFESVERRRRAALPPSAS